MTNTDQTQLSVLVPSTFCFHLFDVPLHSTHSWSNADRDMLVCSCCGAALAILFHPNLSTKAATSITNSYRQQLATSHTLECSFRLEAEKYLIQLGGSGNGLVESSSDRLVTIPTALSSVFPPESVELIEHPFPSSSLQKTTDQLELALRRAVTKHHMLLQEDVPQQGECPWKYPELELSTEVDSFQLPKRENLVAETGGSQEKWNMITEARKIIGTDNNMTTALALFGWIPVSAAEDEAANTAESSKQGLPEHGGSLLTPVVSVGCPICFAWMDIQLTKTDAPEPTIIIVDASSSAEAEDTGQEEGRPTISDRKRRRTRDKYPNPLEGHRHYCPWVCGFPTQYAATTDDEVPVWKTVATRLFQEKAARYLNSSIPDDKDFETSVDKQADRTFERVRQILQLGIVSTVKTPVDLAH
jgi:C3HC zinc finger-like